MWRIGMILAFDDTIETRVPLAPISRCNPGIGTNRLNVFEENIMQLTQIGVIHSPFERAAGTPVQPFCAAGTEGRIEIFDSYLDGLQDLDGFQRIWVLFWCHRARTPKLRVIPYRDTVAHGLFATRAPHGPIRSACPRCGYTRSAAMSVARRRIGHFGRHARLGHQALCIAVRQLSCAALRLARRRPGQERNRRRRRPI